MQKSFNLIPEIGKRFAFFFFSLLSLLAVVVAVVVATSVVAPKKFFRVENETLSR